jgi:hypothetical protein
VSKLIDVRVTVRLLHFCACVSLYRRFNRQSEKAEFFRELCALWFAIDPRCCEHQNRAAEGIRLTAPQEPLRRPKKGLSGTASRSSKPACRCTNPPHNSLFRLFSAWFHSKRRTPLRKTMKGY